MLNGLTRLDILKKVEKGEINLDDASSLLSAFYENVSMFEDDVNVERIEDINEPDLHIRSEINKPDWSIVFWIIPLLSGVTLTIFSSTWLYQNYNTAGLGIRFWFTMIPFIIGIILIYLGWVFQSAQWMHIIIKQPMGEKPENIVLGFPLPIKMTASFLNTIKKFLPSNVRQLDFIEFINAFDGQASKENPLAIHIDDEDGTKVDIFII